jgi:hypothetical protein
MKGERFEITRAETFGPADDPSTDYLVRRPSWPAGEKIRVNVSRHADGRLMCRCVSCSGPLVASLATCSHARAVNRHLKAQAKQEPAREGAIGELRRALELYDKATAAPDGSETGVLRDAHEWVFTAARKVVA